MKKIIAIMILLFISSWFVQATDNNIVWWDKDEHGCIPSAGYTWNADKNQCTRAWEETKEEVRICTMEYAPVCSINWVTYGNKCTAWDEKIAYTWECDKYIDNNLLKKFNLLYKNRLIKKLSNISDEKLVKAIEKADKLIENTKLLKITEELQRERITKYKFLRDLISSELASR